MEQSGNQGKTVQDKPTPHDRLAVRDSPAAPGRGRRHLGGFVVAGAFGFVVDAGVLGLGLWLGLVPALARIPSFLAAVLTTWLINRSFTFRTRQSPSLAEFLRYLTAMALGLAINYAVFLTVIWASPLLAGLPVLALVPATLAGMVVNFVTSRRILDR